MEKQMRSPEGTSERAEFAAKLSNVVSEVVVRWNTEPRHSWTTWDSFAGRSVTHSESDEVFRLRLVCEALERMI